MHQLHFIRDKQAISAADLTWTQYIFCGPSPGMFLLILCLSRMTSDKSHVSLLTARFRTRLFPHVFLKSFIDYLYHHNELYFPLCIFPTDWKQAAWLFVIQQFWNRRVHTILGSLQENANHYIQGPRKYFLFCHLYRVAPKVPERHYFR